MYSKCILIFTLFFLANGSISQAQVVRQAKSVDDSRLQWPAWQGSDTRPWTWWWWHGAAVNKTDIIRELEEMYDACIGGVCIVCLLDVQEDNAKSIPYLSKE